MATVKKNLKNIEKRMKLLQSSSKTTGIPAMLIAAGNYLQLTLRKLWESGTGGNDKTLQSPRGNKNYLQRKSEKTGRGIIDMFGAGKGDHMVNQLGVETRTKLQAAVGFKTVTARQKAAGNYETRPQFMTLSKRLKDACVQKAYEFYIRVVGK